MCFIMGTPATKEIAFWEVTRERNMGRLIAVAFTLVLALSAQAMPVPPIQQPAEMVTLVREGCGAGNCVAGVLAASNSVLPSASRILVCKSFARSWLALPSTLGSNVCHVRNNLSRIASATEQLIVVLMRSSALGPIDRYATDFVVFTLYVAKQSSCPTAGVERNHPTITRAAA